MFGFSVVQGGAEVFILESTGCGFTLRSISNVNFVEIQDNKLSATGASGVIIDTKACDTDRAGFGALRADTNADGNPFNDEGTYWKSNGSIRLTGSCKPESFTSWEKFQVVVILADVDCEILVPSQPIKRNTVPAEAQGTGFTIAPPPRGFKYEEKCRTLSTENVGMLQSFLFCFCETCIFSLPGCPPVGISHKVVRILDPMGNAVLFMS
jgi:hypothetical protein